MRRFDPLNNIDVFNVKLVGSVMERQLSLKILSVSFTSMLDRSWKTAFKELPAWVLFINILSPEVVLYLYKSIIQLCVKRCCNLWSTNCH